MNKKIKMRTLKIIIPILAIIGIAWFALQYFSPKEEWQNRWK